MQNMISKEIETLNDVLKAQHLIFFTTKPISFVNPASSYGLMSPSGRNKHYINGLFLIFHHSKVQPTITQPSTYTHLLHPENLLAVPLWALVI